MGALGAINALNTRIISIQRSGCVNMNGAFSAAIEKEKTEMPLYKLDTVAYYI